MKLSAADMSQRRQVMLKAAYRLFSQRNIASVTMAQIAAETGYTLRSLQRYFKAKDELVIETATWAWDRFMEDNRKNRKKAEETSAAEDYAFFLDSFLTLYRGHADLLRFNQFFNVYVRAECLGAKQLSPYQGMMDALRERFRAVFAKGQVDGTLKSGVSEEEMFSVTLHIMLAAVTRYAVGLVYQSRLEPEEELVILRDMLYNRYAAQ